MALNRAKDKGAYQVRSWSSLDKNEAIPMWKSLGFGLCPATTYSKGQEVKGYFVTKPLFYEVEKEESVRISETHPIRVQKRTP